MNISRSEIKRYLGMSQVKQKDVEPLIEECLEVITAACSPRYLVRDFALEWENGFPVIDGELVASSHLAKNLQGCTSVVFFVATLGAEVDRRIRRAQAVSMARAAVLQACAAAVTEAFCDEINQTIRDDAKKEGLICHPRYSPGFGDLTLDYQKTVFRKLNPERIGVTLNDSLLMSPSKSVTALIGRKPMQEGTSE